jgi:nucleotide-binding universal stress UspA family protein
VIEPFRIFTADSRKVSASREDYDGLSGGQADQFLTDLELRARYQGVISYAIKLKSDQVHEAIVQADLRNGCDLIAIGSHGRDSLAGLIPGSVTNKVLSHSRVPVLVYR